MRYSLHASALLIAQLMLASVAPAQQRALVALDGAWSAFPGWPGGGPDARSSGPTVQLSFYPRRGKVEAELGSSWIPQRTTNRSADPRLHLLRLGPTWVLGTDRVVHSRVGAGLEHLDIDAQTIDCGTIPDCDLTEPKDARLYGAYIGWALVFRHLSPLGGVIDVRFHAPFGSLDPGGWNSQLEAAVGVRVRY